MDPNSMLRLLALGSLSLLLHSADLPTKGDQYLRDQAATAHFTGSALIGQNGKVLFSRGYGLANVEWKIPNTPQTRFRIASLTKQFTAAAVLLLQEKGKLRVNDPISQYVDDLPPSWRPVTLHQLLTHTSGVPSYTDSPEIARINRLGASPRPLLDLVRDRPLQFPPGRRFSYSNSGYVLLGMVIERASGQSYAAFLEQHIFAPLGMRHSGYDLARVILPERAEGYQLRDGKLEHADFLDMSVPWSAGGLYSTVEDLFLWSEALANVKLLSKDSLAQMFRVYPEAAHGGQHYGYGIVLARRFDQSLQYHGGGIHGFSSAIQRYPKSNVSVVVLSNLESIPSWNLATSLARLALRP